MARTPKNRTTKLCPVCGFKRPLDDFYRIKAKRYAGGYRCSERCIEHTKAATGTNLRERLARDPALRERQRIAKQESAARHRSPQAPRAEITLREAGVLLSVCYQRVAQWQTDGRLPKPLTRAAVEQLAHERDDAAGGLATIARA